MGVAYNSRIVTDGLVVCLDAANRKSYPGDGNTWIDLSMVGNHGTLQNTTTFMANTNSFYFNGTTPMSMHVYNTYTDASNYERASIGWTANSFNISVQAAGTGSTRGIDFFVNGARRFWIASTGQMIFFDQVSFNNNIVYGCAWKHTAATSNGAIGEASSIYTNTGATGLVVRTLNTYTYDVTCIRVASQAFRIAPPTAAYSFVRANGTVEAAGKYLELASDNASFKVMWIGSNKIFLTQEQGTITVEP